MSLLKRQFSRLEIAELRVPRESFQLSRACQIKVEAHQDHLDIPRLQRVSRTAGVVLSLFHLFQL